MTPARYYLICPKRYIACYRDASDRAYFSRPVLVEPVHCDAKSRTLYVYDPARGCQFPVDPKTIKPHWSLTNKQAKQVS